MIEEDLGERTAVHPLALVRGTGRRPELSPRETEVLRVWLFTDSKRETAARLYLAEGTVNTYLARVRSKYAIIGRPAPTKVALLARALQDGVVRIDEF